MAHKKAGGSKARQGSKPAGKRLGVKIFGGQKVTPGGVIVRQKGNVFHAGPGVGTGRDFTLFATKEGIVSMGKNKGKNVVSVEGGSK
jgi:large subunit ribosomal protein L27